MSAVSYSGGSFKATFVFVLTLVFAQVGCARSPEPSDDEGPDAIDQTVTIVRAEVPKRYSAPLPSSASSLDAWLKDDSSLPPVAHVVDNILLGDLGTLGRLTEASIKVRAAEVPDWVSKWAELFEFGEVSPAFCTHARPIMNAPPSTIRAALSTPFASSCADSADLALIVRADTPNAAVLSFFDPWGYDGMQRRIDYHPRLASAAREVIANASAMQARLAAFVLAEQHDPQVEAALVRIHSEIKDQEKADQVAMAFLRSKNADVRALAVGACKRRPNDAMCTREPLPEEQDDLGLGEDERVAAAAIKERIDQLASIGFHKVASLEVSEMDSDVAELLLQAAGHAYWFDVETGMYPNQHDSLMRRLSSLIAPELDAAVFEELAPELDDESAPYELVAYAGGKKYRTLAANLGDWYDVNAVLRLMNTITEDQKSQTRFVSLATEDQTMIIVAAPSATIAAAVKQGLLQLGDPSEAERLGKDFEDRVLKSLR